MRFQPIFFHNISINVTRWMCPGGSSINNPQRSLFSLISIYAGHICRLVFPQLAGPIPFEDFPVCFFFRLRPVKWWPIWRIWSTHPLLPTYLQLQSAITKDLVLLTARTVVAVQLSVQIIRSFTSSFSGVFGSALVGSLPVPSDGWKIFKQIMAIF